jgi:hypothetical protein
MKAENAALELHSFTICFDVRNELSNNNRHYILNEITIIRFLQKSLECVPVITENDEIKNCYGSKLIASLREDSLICVTFYSQLIENQSLIHQIRSRYNNIKIVVNNNLTF